MLLWNSVYLMLSLSFLDMLHEMGRGLMPPCVLFKEQLLHRPFCTLCLVSVGYGASSPGISAERPSLLILSACSLLNFSFSI
jgi:hypothetical protein